MKKKLDDKTSFKDTVGMLVVQDVLQRTRTGNGER